MDSGRESLSVFSRYGFRENEHISIHPFFSSFLFCGLSWMEGGGVDVLTKGAVFIQVDTYVFLYTRMMPVVTENE